MLHAGTTFPLLSPAMPTLSLPSRFLVRLQLLTRRDSPLPGGTSVVIAALFLPQWRLLAPLRFVKENPDEPTFPLGMVKSAGH
jgi:hypothetical protein